MNQPASDESGAQPPEPRRRTARRRVVAAPASLQVSTELTGSYAPLPKPENVEQAMAHSHSAQQPTAAAAPTGVSDPLGALRAKDEDPAGWGESREDLGEAMKREKPPHWG